MINIVHLSDLHFGTEKIDAIASLIATVNELQPEVIVISGDFTQRAKVHQFKSAKNLIEQLACANIICVPGNHDIPLHNIFSRIFFPLKNYKQFITDNLNPYFIQDKVAILGINSTTPFTVMDGFISPAQLNMLKEKFLELPPDIIKIACMHHNMIKPEYHKVIINLDALLKTLAECRVNLILAGHLHDAFIEKIERDFIHHPMYVVTAGTTLSYRLRTQPNSFNFITLHPDGFSLQIYELLNQRFHPQEKRTFRF